MTAAAGTREVVVRATGLTLTLAGGSLLLWLFVQQPTNFEQLTGGVAATVGAYAINQAEFDQGRQFFEADKFVEARAAFMRADPASRDARRKKALGSDPRVARCPGTTSRGVRPVGGGAPT